MICCVLFIKSYQASSNVVVDNFEHLIKNDLYQLKRKKKKKRQTNINNGNQLEIKKNHQYINLSILNEKLTKSTMDKIR